MRFGVQEVIRPISLNKIVSERDLYIAGSVKDHVVKQAESTHTDGNEQEAVRVCLQALKHIQAGKSTYTVIELFTDPKQKGVARMNVCHMHNAN
jgi:hypothetical protein